MVAVGRRLAIAGLFAGCACAPANTLVIRGAGTYTLDSDLTGPGPVITVAADDVVLDLNGKTIQCSDSDNGVDSIGIDARRRSSVTIMNGAVVGCNFGIAAHQGRKVVVDTVDLSGNRVAGVELAEGAGNVVRCSRFVGITGHGRRIYSYGINGIGRDGLIEHNTFGELYRQRDGGVGEGVGIVVEEGATGVTVRDNMFFNTEHVPHTIAIWSAVNAETEVQDNTISNFERGVQGDTVVVRRNSFAVASALPSTIAIHANRGIAAENAFSGYHRTIGGGVVEMPGWSYVAGSEAPCR